MSDSKPTAITAAEFIEGGYAAKIKAGECVVKSPLYKHYVITDVKPIKANSSGWDVAITDTKGTYRTWTSAGLTVTWLPQADSAKPEGEVSDAVALARAQIARLRSALETIRDYPTVEVDMELGHQVAGMAMQAEVALEEYPSESGLLTILADKLTAAQADLATAREQVARLRAALLTKSEIETLELVDSDDDVDLDIFDRLVERGLIVCVTTFSDSGESVYCLSDLAAAALAGDEGGA